MPFDSGLPQPADFWMVLLFATFLRPSHLKFVMKYHLWYIAFVVWVVLVNGGWGTLRLHWQYIFRFAFQVYNLGIFALVFRTRTTHPATFDRWAVVAVAAAAWVQLAIAMSPTGYRATGTFNNSNQLAYWGVCLGATYLLVQRQRSWRDLLVLGPIFWVELVALSRAGLVAYLIVVATWLFELLRYSKHRVLYFVGLVAAALLVSTLPAVGAYTLELEVADKLEARFTKESAADELTLRNTDRISHYPQYAFFGAGEGDYSRFPHTHQIEIHSTPMTIIFSYGLIGVMTFGAFLVTLARRVPPERQALMLALFAYSATHNGMRFTFFWFCLALIAAEPWAVAAYGDGPGRVAARN